MTGVALLTAFNMRVRLTLGLIAIVTTHTGLPDYRGMVHLNAPGRGLVANGAVRCG